MPRDLYEHSIRTAETAREMAAAFGLDAEKAYLVGLVHDCGKALSDVELLDAARAEGWSLNEVEIAEPYLLHDRVSAVLARERFGVDDAEVLSAVEKHTLGDESMSPLDKIAYVADMVEPGRPYPGLDALRGLALENLDASYAEAYAHTIGYLARARKPIHPKTVPAWNSIVLGGSK
ncbi:MAG: bis(5'-nucleosyl)-tetraphosphatase (symmetrical) YqeK [Candidatus Aquicultorales bacterium]